MLDRRLVSTAKNDVERGESNGTIAGLALRLEDAGEESRRHRGRRAGAGGIGLLFAWWAVRLLVTAISDSLPAVWGTLALQVDPDLRVFGYTLIVSLLAGILFGLAPALEASKPNLTAVLKEECIFGGKLRGSRMRDTLVAPQVGICIVILVTAGLLARGSARALRLDPGFETKKVLGMGIEIPPGLGYDATKAGAIVGQLVDRLSNVPGVKSVSQGR